MTRRGVFVLAVCAVACGCAPTPPCGLQRCDIRQPDCQRVVAEAVSCLREVPTVDVPMTVVSRDDYVRQQAAEADTPENQASFQNWNAGFTLLGLSSASVSLSDAATASALNVGAFYSPEDKAITIVDADYPFDARAVVALLGHEYTHALQDAAFGFDAYDTAHASDHDRASAAYAVTEGEATMVGDMVDAGLFGRDFEAIPWTTVFDRWKQGSRLQSAASAFPVILAWRFFRYPFGTPFVHDAFVAESWAGVDRLRADPPGGTREILAGFGATEPAGGPWNEDLGADAVPVLPAPFVYFDSDRMGAWILEQFVTRLDPRPTVTLGDLRGDVLSLFQNPSTGGVLAVWRLRFASVESAQTLAAAIWVSTWANTSGVVASALTLDRDLLLFVAPNVETLVGVPFPPTFQPVPPQTQPSSMNATWARAAGCAVAPAD